MVVNDCYILQSRIGEDSYTEHWIATAIFSATEFLLRFLKSECETKENAANFRHDAIKGYQVQGLQIEDFIEIESFEGRTFVSSEYHGERSLIEIIDSGENWSLVQVCGFIITLAEGLSMFHDIGLTYGSCNAENVLVKKINSATLFLKIRKPGMLELLPSLSPDLGQIAENYGYLAPEYKNSSSLTAANDIYSLGIHLVRFVTGRLPYPDTAGLVKTESASLRYVTNSLLRRSCPESLVRIVLRCLMVDPAMRYESGLDLVRDLKSFLSDTVVIPSTEGTVRKAPVVQANTTVIRTFDSSEYFNTLISGTPDYGPARKSVYPVKNLSGSPEIPETEKRELEITAAERGWTIDDYIANGKRVVNNVKEHLETEGSEDLAAVKAAAAAIIPPAPPAAPPVSATPAPSVTTKPSARVTAETPVSAPTPVTAAVSPVTVSAATPMSASPAEPTASSTVSDLSAVPSVAQTIAPTAPPVSTDVKKEGARKRGSPHLNQVVSGSQVKNKPVWTYSRILRQDVRNIVEFSIQRARKGKGSFRYIQEPDSGYAYSGMFNSLESLGKDALFLNIGSCAKYGTADISDFIKMLRNGITRGLSNESEKSAAYLKRTVGRQDEFGLFGKTPARNLPDDKERLNMSIVHSVRALGRRKKPLVIVVRGGERIQKNLHELLTILARDIETSPVCVVVFFERIQFPVWHALSLLSQNQG